MVKKLRPVLSLFIKAGVSALLLYLSLRSVDLTGVMERINQINIVWLVTVALIQVVQVGLLGMRWREIAVCAGARLGVKDALRFSLIAMFFNQTLPSTIGGDAARVWMLARHCSNWRVATYSVLLDRAIGLFALAALVLAFLPYTLELVRAPLPRIALIAIGLAGVCGPLAFLASGFIRSSFLDRIWATRHTIAAAKVAWQLLSSPRAATSVVAFSVTIHILSALAACAAASAVSAPLSLTLALSIILPVMLISTVPISIAGWGVRESMMIAAFSYAGLQQGDGLLVSLILGVSAFIVGILGGLLWVISGERVVPAGAAPQEANQDLR